MFPNLEAEIAKRRIKKRLIAEKLGISYKAFYNKMNGLAPFFLDEAVTIYVSFFYGADFLELFQKRS